MGRAVREVKEESAIRCTELTLRAVKRSKSSQLDCLADRFDRASFGEG